MQQTKAPSTTAHPRPARQDEPCERRHGDTWHKARLTSASHCRSPLSITRLRIELQSGPPPGRSRRELPRPWKRLGERAPAADTMVPAPAIDHTVDTLSNQSPPDGARLTRRPRATHPSTADGPPSSGSSTHATDRSDGSQVARGGWPLALADEQPTATTRLIRLAAHPPGGGAAGVAGTGGARAADQRAQAAVASGCPRDAALLGAARSKSRRG